MTEGTVTADNVGGHFIMMRSMYAGVAGLKTHQTRMDVIGNNIANVNTVAYKSQNVTFSELMYQTTQNASGPNATTGTGGINARQIGLGVKTGAINTNISTQGASQTTNNPFDIMITGEAFFIVSNGSDNFFTRDGSFYVDGAGNLAMTSNGYNVMGWGVDPETMDIKQDTVQPLRIMSPENMSYPPEATTKGYMSGILDKNDTSVTSSSGKNVNLQLYDSLGYSYTAKFNFKSTDVEGVYALSLGGIVDENNEPINLEGLTFGGATTVKRENTVTMSPAYKWKDGNIYDSTETNVIVDIQKLGITVTNDSVTITPESELVDGDKEEIIKNRKALAEIYGVENIEELDKKIITKDANGGDLNPSISVLNALVGTNANIDKTEINYQEEKIQGVIVEYDPTTGTFKGVNGGNESFMLELSKLPVSATNKDSKFEDITVDLTTTTMFNNSGSSTLAATSGDTKGLGSGRRLGEMTGISIQSNGMIYASYDNGQTKLLGQIAVAEFSNPSGLEKQGDNLYSATLNSGEFDGMGVDITTSGGYMNTGVLEMSNVDLSAEFTDMITTQRGFQANSRIITVSDTLLEELINLKR